MKRKSIILALSASLLSLSACGGEALEPYSEDHSRHADILLAGGDGPSKTGASFDLFFQKGSEIPFVSLEQGFLFLNAIKAGRFEDATNSRYFYRLAKEGGKVVATDEKGATATFDPSTQTIVYSDFDSFVSLVSEQNRTLALGLAATSGKAMKFLSSSFEKGGQLTIDLKPYDKLRLVEKDDQLYIPFHTFNDLFYSVYEYSNLAYNFKDVYLVPNDSLTKRVGGKTVLTPSGQAFYGATKKSAVSEEYASYNLQEQSLLFDYLYGLKDLKGYSSFESFLSEKGFLNEAKSTNPKVADAAMGYALSHLDDGHTSEGAPSTLYEWGTAEEDSSRYYKPKIDWLKAGVDFQAVRNKKAETDASAKLGNYLDEAHGVYYITFNDFIEINEKLLYGQADQEAIASSTALQFGEAYRFLSSDANKGKAKTVVVDLSTNDGGASDALLFGLSTLLGEVKTVIQNPLTGALNQATYKADINLDGTIDSSDVGLAEKGYHIAIMSSIYTYSSGNALPAIAKANNAKVMTIGEKSAGGACAVRPLMNSLAASNAMSSTSRISTKDASGKITSVEAGVPADHAIEREKMFDRAFISEQVNSWFGGE